MSSPLSDEHKTTKMTKSIYGTQFFSRFTAEDAVTISYTSIRISSAVCLYLLKKGDK